MSAAVSQPHVVSAWPAAWTPNLSGGTVRGNVIVGNEVVSGGGCCFNDPSCKPVTVNGVGAVNAATGLAISTWTPGKTRGHGTELLQAFSGGLFIGSDGNYIHGEYRGEIGMFPLK